MEPSLPEHQLAEVSVHCDEEGAPVVGLPQNVLVRKARRELRYVEDVVAISPQSLHHRPIHAFIREQIHADRVVTG